MDLLLHLVSKHKLNIYDIEISLLLEQYLDYMAKIEVQDYEQAADFLEMAARLIYIKTCYLLPKPEEAEELKKELEGRMIEYSLCRLTAQKLREQYAGGSIFVRRAVRLPVNKTYSRTHDVTELYNAYMSISTKAREYHPLRANVFSPIVAHKIVSVESKITQILELLYTTGSFKMSELYDGMSGRSERIAAFLAVLELTKSGRITLNDDNTEVTLRRDYDPDIEEETDEEQEIPLAEDGQTPEAAAVEISHEAETSREEDPVEQAAPLAEDGETPEAATVENEITEETHEYNYETEVMPEPDREPHPRPQSASLAIASHRLMMAEPAVPAFAPMFSEQEKAPKPDRAQEAETQPTPDIQPEQAAEITAETEPNRAQEAEAEPTPNIQPEQAAEITAETEPEQEQEAETEPTPDTQPEQAAEITAETEPEQEAETEPTPDIQPEQAAEITAETEPEQAEPSRLPEDTGFTLKANLWGERWYWGKPQDHGLSLNTKTRIN